MSEDYRELGILEIEKRIRAVRTEAGLRSYRRTPSRPIDEKYLPCVYLHEGVDIIIENSNRNSHGFPRRRICEIYVETILEKEAGHPTAIKDVFRKVRSSVLGSSSALVGKHVQLYELRTEGPMGYGLPDVIGMNLILGMRYFEESF